MAIHEKSIETARGSMRWLEAGAGWPVILLHAFPLSARMWRPQLERTPAGCRLIAPDYMAPASRSVDDYADAVLALMDALELEDAVIGGLSLGGYVTFAIHRREPSRFTGMILADTKAAADTPAARQGRVALREVLAREGAAGVAAQMIPALLSEAGRQPGAAALAETTAMIQAASPEAIDAAIGALMSRPDSTPELAAIGCATLILVGAEDRVTPLADAELMQQSIRRSTLSVIPDAGHLSSLEQPEAFSRVLADFLLARL
jgi:3-oxoadipate enol-lactonase